MRISSTTPSQLIDPQVSYIIGGNELLADCDCSLRYFVLQKDLLDYRFVIMLIRRQSLGLPDDCFSFSQVADNQGFPT